MLRVTSDQILVPTLDVDADPCPGNFEEYISVYSAGSKHAVQWRSPGGSPDYCFTAR